MKRSFKPITILFWALLAITFFYWLIRGFGLLTALPGLVLWLLILLSIVTGLISRFQRF